MAYIVKAFTPGKLNLAPETLAERRYHRVNAEILCPTR